MLRKEAIVNINECVACGSCVKICPLNIITIEQGVFAKVKTDKCVGCGKCAKACPASIIEIIKVEVDK